VVKVPSAAAGRDEEPLPEPGAFAFGPFVVDVAARELRRDGTPVALPPKAVETLLVLVRGRHGVLEKDELIGTCSSSAKDR
jgi:DNA-binding winged helix-turn-helix (wHTH) protein